MRRLAARALMAGLAGAGAWMATRRRREAPAVARVAESPVAGRESPVVAASPVASRQSPVAAHPPVVGRRSPVAGAATRAELYREAQAVGLKGRSSMNKAQLERALAEHRRRG